MGARLVLGDEQGGIPGVWLQLVVAYRKHEISFRTQHQTTNRIREPAAAYRQVTQSFRQPGFDFYSMVHHPASNPLFQAFARHELGEDTAERSLERTPVLERPMDDLSCSGIAVQERQ